MTLHRGLNNLGSPKCSETEVRMLLSYCMVTFTDSIVWMKLIQTIESRLSVIVEHLVMNVPPRGPLSTVQIHHVERRVRTIGAIFSIDRFVGASQRAKTEVWSIDVIQTTKGTPKDDISGRIRSRPY